MVDDAGPLSGDQTAIRDSEWFQSAFVLKDCAELSNEVPSPDQTTRSVTPTIRRWYRQYLRIGELQHRYQRPIALDLAVMHFYVVLFSDTVAYAKRITMGTKQL